MFPFTSKEGDLETDGGSSYQYKVTLLTAKKCLGQKKGVIKPVEKHEKKI